LLLGSQPRLVRRVVHGRDTRKELFVLRDAVVELGELRLHLALDRLVGVVAHRRAIDAVDGVRAIERPPGRLQRGDRVRKRRRLRIVGDALDLGPGLGHAGFERGLEVRYVNGIERRRATVRAWPRLQQRAPATRGGDPTERRHREHTEHGYDEGSAHALGSRR
jgi:hypothetical protein